MKVFINPGTSEVLNATEKYARDNIKHFVIDNNVDNVKWVRIPERDCAEGRYAFLLWKDNVCHEIQMPGLALEKVRFMDNEDQDIWDFPRLYVDGSSWVWVCALGLFLDEKTEWLPERRK